MNMKLLSVLRSSVLAAACVSLNACANETTPSGPELKTECVGRFQLDIPSEVAITPSLILASSESDAKNSTGNVISNMETEDSADQSDVNHASISVSKNSTHDQFLVFKQNFIKKRLEDSTLKTGLYDPPPTPSHEQKVDLPNAFSWSWDSNILTYIYRADRVFVADVSKYKREASYSKSRLQYFLANFSPRAIYAIPAQQGVCIPYGFIKDDGSKPYDVIFAMRLIDHPDVEIIFKDANSGNESPNRLSEFKGSRGHVQNFWSFYEPSQGNKLDGTTNHYHDVDLGGYKGVYATATIARPIDQQNTSSNETQAQYSTRIKREMAEGKYPLDYGFVAYYKGDYNKPGDPNLMLTVIRTASRAIAAGKEPVTQEELYAMAKRIAASIKRRPIQ